MPIESDAYREALDEFGEAARQLGGLNRFRDDSPQSFTEGSYWWKQRRKAQARFAAAEAALDAEVDRLVEARTKTDGTQLPGGVTKGELPPMTWDY